MKKKHAWKSTPSSQNFTNVGSDDGQNIKMCNMGEFLFKGQLWKKEASLKKSGTVDRNVRIQRDVLSNSELAVNFYFRVRISVYL